MTVDVTMYQPRASSMDRLFGFLMNPFWPWLEANRNTWRVRQLPNILTTVRLIIALPVVYCLGSALQAGDDPLAILFWSLIFMALFASDGLDGTIANRLGIVSGYGRIVDPIADKVLVIGLMLALGLAGTKLLDAKYAQVLVALIVIRVIVDVVLVSITFAELKQRRNPRAEVWGKRKLVADGVTAVLLTLGLGLIACNHPWIGLPIYAFGCFMLLFASGLGLLSIDGHWKNLRVANKAA